MLSPAGTFLKPQLPHSRAQRLPRAPCPRMSSLDGTVTWGEAPRVPSTQERGRAGRHRPGSFSLASGHGCLLCARLHGAGVALGACGLKGPQCHSGSVHDSICQRLLAPLPVVLWMDSLDWGLGAFENQRPSPQ